MIVRKPGLLTTVQDLGRWGFQHEGVPVAGPMDPWAHRRANRLVGNPDSAATLEATIIGPRLELETDLTFAVSGAEFPLMLDGRPAPWDEACAGRAGQLLEFGRARRGARAYLAVAGGIDVPLVLGSRATHLPSRMGGVDGRGLIANDRLRIGPGVGPGPPPSGIRGVDLEPPARGVRVRVLPGPEAPGDAAALERLCQDRYQVGVESNRMGYRLEGPAIDVPSAAAFSTATPMGTIQVPPAGQPILLMADRQTTGGYARVAVIISADVGLAGQLAPGDWIAFDVCDLEEARAALAEREARLV